MSWISATETVDDDNNFALVPQRHFSSGRRHGWKGDTEKKPKTNFSKEYLEPAAQGELKEKHSSGIPKLSVRKTKGHGIQGEWDYDALEGSDSDEEIIPEVEEGSLVQTLTEDIARAKAKKKLMANVGAPALNAL